MTRDTTASLICGGLFIAATLVCPAADGAELRTTLVGTSVSRQVAYQPAIEPMVTPGLSPLEEISPGETYADANDWLGASEPASCGSVSGPCGYWGGFEFLLWWRRGQDVPALITTSSSGTTIDNAGILGDPGTQILYGDQTHGNDAHPGGRLTIGKWLDSCQILGLGARLYAVGESTANYQNSNDEIPILARPFFNATLVREDSDVVAFPDISTGSLSVNNTARVGGGDVFLRRLIYDDSCRRVDLIAGYQFARIDQDLTIASSRTSIDPNGSIPVGTVLDVEDLFATKNQYQAGELGFLAEYDRGLWTWSLLGKVGLGTMQQRVSIDGQTWVTTPGQATTSSNQGLLALNTNIGTYSQDVFAVSPEIALNATYHLSDTIDLSVGYSFIHWNRVAQPAAQIDTTLNTSQIPGTLTGEARPEFRFEESGYFVQGLNFGIAWIF